MNKIKFEVFGAVISALADAVCGVGLYMTYEAICIVFGALATMALITCICGVIEEGGRHE